MDFLARPKTVSIQIMGDERSMIWDYYGGKLICSNQGNVDEDAITFDRPLDRNQMFLDVVRDFLEATESGGKPRSDLADGVTALRIVEGIKESLSSGQMVEIGS
jgi:predicted dehydrogenase